MKYLSLTNIQHFLDKIKTFVLDKINAIPEPFAKNATGAEADAAIVSLNNLSTALDKANDALLNN